ncbi:uncharacterized protein DUF4163 [Aneurinibacillus soli]|uniref:DUF3298 domain-containing protein n=1 Tax=Aneurinibacillus soli TaxID=1500254 RepID=A0A0U5B405_9BACL|nr:DUF3298 and DUF4163 domain-containing protein [Aneurinibacillus soli]PYE60121.1 uncharacterized protein DUF4163 [Aneurinibacillus soli]BAU26390.1 hypothetical protein CB4_00517 [Aneurinibacillus soli]
MSENKSTVLVEAKELVQPRLKLTYPDVHIPLNRRVQKNINRDIHNVLTGMLRADQYPNAEDKEFGGGYEVKANESQVLSLVFELYYYADGTAHGMVTYRSRTYNTQTGHAYTLAELFRRGSDWQKRLNKEIKRQFKKRDIPQTAPFETVIESTDYFVTPQDLVIYFQLYEYTPYAYGVPEFAIPMASLQDIANPSGPLARIGT